MLVPRSFFQSLFCHILGSDHACAQVILSVLVLSYFGFRPCLCPGHSFSPCFAISWVQTMLVPRSFFQSLFCHILGSDHACAQVILSVLVLPYLGLAASSILVSPNPILLVVFSWVSYLPLCGFAIQSLFCYLFLLPSSCSQIGPQ